MSDATDPFFELWKSFKISDTNDDILIVGYIKQQIEQIYHTKIPNEIKHICHKFWGKFNNLPSIGQIIQLKDGKVGTIRYQ